MAEPLIRPPDIEADITYLSTESGGRKSAVRSGYRPNHDFGLDGMLNDAHHEYAGVESVAPGQTARARIWLLAPDYQLGRLHPGFGFKVLEGAHVVAHAVIVSVLNTALRSGA